jgi:hypothetical protein
LRVLLMGVVVKIHSKLLKLIDNIKYVVDSFDLGSGLPCWSFCFVQKDSWKGQSGWSQQSRLYASAVLAQKQVPGSNNVHLTHHSLHLSTCW